MQDGNMKTSPNWIDYSDTLSSFGIKKMEVIYAERLLTNEQADPEKIKKIVEATKKNPNTPICFDIEIGNRKKPETNLPVILDALDIYHQLGGKAPIGVYAALPQETPNKTISNAQKKEFSLLNEKYEEIAKRVDFLTPSLYFYGLQDMDVWKDGAQFNMQEAKKYARKYNLKIYPFIALSNWQVKNKTFFITPLPEKNMTTVLTFLKSKGADGVILWESTLALHKSDNHPAIFDMNKDSFKSVINFVKNNK